MDDIAASRIDQKYNDQNRIQLQNQQLEGKSDSARLFLEYHQQHKFIFINMYLQNQKHAPSVP